MTCRTRDTSRRRSGAGLRGAYRQPGRTERALCWRRARLFGSRAGLYELFGDAGQLIYGSDDLDTVAEGFVERHVAGTQIPAPFWLRCDPDDLPGVLGHLLECPYVRVLAVVASVAEHDQGRPVVYGRKITVLELLCSVTEVAIHVGVDEAAGEDLIDGPVHGVLFEDLRHLGNVGHEHKGPYLREQALHLV